MIAKTDVLALEPYLVSGRGNQCIYPPGGPLGCKTIPRSVLLCCNPQIAYAQHQTGSPHHSDKAPSTVVRYALSYDGRTMGLGLGRLLSLASCSPCSTGLAT